MILIKNALIYPVTSPSFKGDVLLKNGKIEKLEKEISLTNTEQVQIIDAKGKFVFPGFIDSHTHLGLYDEGTGWAGNDANETIETMTPHIRSMDGIYPLDVAFQDAKKMGITTAHVMPGSANVIGGTTCVIKTEGKDIEKMCIKEPAGLKIALGENPKKMHSDGSQNSITRMGIMGMLRETFMMAKNYGDENHPRMKPILKALKREIPVRIHAHRADDILSAIRFANEFNLDLRIEHATEGHLIAEEMVANYKNLKVSIGPTMTRRSKVELKNKSWDAYSALQQAGVELSITTDHPYVPIQYLNIAASIAVREGLPEEEALKGITINPAKNLGVNNRVGSLEIGKDADVVIWDNHPLLSALATPLYTIIDGKIVYEKK